MSVPSVLHAKCARGLVAALALAAGACGGAAPSEMPEPLDPPAAKPVSFSILEDYDNGEDLAEVARDFALMRELDVMTWRGSFGWDDYQPAPDRFDLDWLHRFVRLARDHGITLRPYLGYTAPWAAAGREADGNTWNDPPARLQEWAGFVSRLGRELARYPNITSFEIYNEQNVSLWWDGSVAEYAAVLGRADSALAAAAPGIPLLPGGLVWPDAEWLETVCEAGAARRVAAFPFHAYPETWTPESVTVESYLDAGYREGFLPAVDRCGGRPVWINEMGYATTPGRSEEQQADWWARAVATFLADPRVEHIGIYEIKDLRGDSPVIGDEPNYHLGLTRVDRTPKLAFRTVDLLTDLLDTGTITPADAELSVRVVGGREGRLYHHLFLRPDGDQVLFVWDRTGAPTVDLRVHRSARSAVEYALDGSAAERTLEHGRIIRGVRLSPGRTRIFLLRAGG